ncbi:vat protein [Cucumis melo var. makuwa]|uniref:Vat protein n=1 Tax=Cucumis melo var. makuwa TaxID=1194695 RepID=A0A5D3D4A2_CUCMM|nr:vat protein [Cucumis melo var. makuwa]
MDILISVIAKIAEYTVEPLDANLIHAARRNAEDIKPAVEERLKKVDDFVRESDEILAHEGGHGRLCSTYLVQRHKLNRKASKMVDEVLEMKNEGESFDTVSYKSVISSVDCSPSKVPDFLDFESIVEQIMDAFSDDNIHRIGVYGMGGVCKTMLVKEILRKIVESKKPCDEVVPSTISQTPDFKSIQGQLADKLGLKFEQETIEGRARILQKRLKMERSILVVLDDVWEYIDLETIGIPGEIVEASDLKPIAIQIVRECAGLPIAITTVAKALRNKPSDIWIDALDQLKSVDVGMANIGQMDKKHMFPEDFNINMEELHVYAMSMGFLHGVDTVVKGRRRIKKLVDDLISSSFLQQYSEYGCNYVKMHDMVRDVALLIASKNDHIRTLSYVKRWNEEWEEERLSVYHNFINFAPKSEKCGQLTVETSTSNTISIGESLFSEEASLPNLEKLKICSAKNLKMIWSNNVLIPNFFSKLKEVDQGNLCKQFDEAEIHSVLRSFMF